MTDETRKALADLLRKYARDLRRNSSGGDNYPWEWAKGVADYLEVLIERAAANDDDAISRTALLKHLRKERDDYFSKHFVQDPATGTYEASNAKEEYLAELDERIEFIENFSVANTLPPGSECKWPFVETPGEFADRLDKARAEYSNTLAAVRYVLIEDPPQMVRAPSPSPREAWRELWYGSAPQRGWGIVTNSGDQVAFIGGDETMSDAVTAIVMAHNAALAATVPPSPEPVAWRTVWVSLNTQRWRLFDNMDEACALSIAENGCVVPLSVKDLLREISAAPPPSPAVEREALVQILKAGDWLSIAAQTSGGTAGRDQTLVDAVDEWKTATENARAALSGETSGSKSDGEAK